MKRLNKWVVIILGLLLCTTKGFANDVSGKVLEQYIGQRVRVDIDTTQSVNLLMVVPLHYKETKKVYGYLDYVDTETLVLEIDSNEKLCKSIQISSINNVYVQAGYHRKTLAGAAIGAGSGLCLAVLTAMGDNFDPEREKFGGADPLLVSSIFVGGGAIIGGVIGSFVKTDKWNKLALSDLILDFSSSSNNGRAQVKLSCRF